ncbi:hypothetical protein HN937_30575 [Candidatus Poribacteria bacterium]|nr:hypothetical protein [Candidatus Poribacteria bacterium]
MTATPPSKSTPKKKKVDPNARLRRSKIAELRRDIRSARSAKSWSALAMLHRQEIMLKGLDAPPFEPDPRPLPDDPLEALLEEARRARMRAEAQGSWGPAHNFFRTQQDIQRALDERERKRQDEAQRASSDGDLLGKFRAELNTLPDLVVENFIQLCQERLQVQ